MNDIALYKSLFGLLVPNAASFPSWDDPQLRDRIRQLARQEKCLPNVLEAWNSTDALEGDDFQTLQRLRKKHLASQEIVRRLPSEAIMLKGAGMQRYYPEGVARYTVDVDLLLNSMHSLGSVQHAMKEVGYVPEGAGPWGLRVDSAALSGVASIRYWTRERTGDAVSVEVQVGGFPLSATSTTVVPFDTLARDAEHLPGLSCRGLSPTCQLTLLLTDFCVRRGPITVRHIADLAHLDHAAGPRIDYDAVARDIERHALKPGVEKLVATAAAKDLSDFLPRRLQTLIDRTSQLQWAPVRRRWRQRMAEYAVSHANRDSAQSQERSWVTHPRLLLNVIRSGVRVYGIPIVSRYSGTPALLHIRDCLYLVNGAGVFALSLSGSVTEARRRVMFDSYRAAPQPTVVARME